MKRWLLVIIVLCAPRAYGEDISAEYYLEKQSNIYYAQPVNLVLKVFHKPGIKPLLPLKTDIQGGAVQVIAEEEMPLQTDPDTNTSWQGRRFTVIFMETGEHELPSLNIAYTNARGEEHTLKTRAIPVNILSNLTGENDTLKDIKGPFTLDKTLRPYFWVAGALLLAGLAVFAFYRLWLRRESKRYKPRAPSIPEDVEARQMLRRLYNEGLLEQQAYKPFVFRLTAIIKHYLGRAYAVNAPDMTTRELKQMLQAKQPDQEHRVRVMHLFQASDPIKFANRVAEREDVETLYHQAGELVDQDAMKRRAALAIGREGGE